MIGAVAHPTQLSFDNLRTKFEPVTLTAFSQCSGATYAASFSPEYLARSGPTAPWKRALRWRPIEGCAEGRPSEGGCCGCIRAFNQSYARGHQICVASHLCPKESAGSFGGPLRFAAWKGKHVLRPERKEMSCKMNKSRSGSYSFWPECRRGNGFSLRRLIGQW